MNLYKYGMTQRGFSPGAQPAGVADWQESDGLEYYDFIFYTKPLTAQQVANFELVYLGETEPAIFTYQGMTPDEIKTEKGRENMERIENLFDNLLTNGFEFVLYKDGETSIRQAGSTGEDERYVIRVINLSTNNWAETLELWGGRGDAKQNYEWIKENCKSDFINEVLGYILYME